MFFWFFMYEFLVNFLLIWYLFFSFGILVFFLVFFLVSIWYNIDWVFFRSVIVNIFNKEALFSEIFIIFFIRDFSLYLKFLFRFTIVLFIKVLLEFVIRFDFGISNISVNLLYCMIIFRVFKVEIWMKDFCIS